MNIGDRVQISTKERLLWVNGKKGTIVIIPDGALDGYYMVQVDDMNPNVPPYGKVLLLENELTVIPENTQGTDDPVNHPSHYTDGKYECIDYIESMGYNRDGYLFNAVKYISRAGKKDPNKRDEDLEKAIWYLERKQQFCKVLNANSIPEIDTEDYIRDKGLEGTLTGIALELIAHHQYESAVKLLRMELNTHGEHSSK